MAKISRAVASLSAFPFGSAGQLARAVKVTLACALPAVAAPMLGAPGTVLGVTLFDAAEGTLDPLALRAVTVHVYAVPLVSPATTMGEPAPVMLVAPHVAV